MRTLIQDLRYGLRVLRSSPGFTAAAVLTLALGIAANTTVFGWMDALLVRPFPGVSDGGRLAAIETLSPTGEYSTTSWRDYRDYRDNAKLSSGLAAALLNSFAVGDQNAQHVKGEYVSSNYFQLLGVRAELGRTLLPSDYMDAAGSAPLAMIGHRLWMQRFHGNRSIIGRTVRVNRHELTIVGVVPAEFHGSVPGLALELWVPMVMAPQLNGQGDWLLTERREHQLWITARLAPGVSFGQADAEIQAIASRIAAISPETSRGYTARLMPIWKAHFGLQWFLIRPLEILMAMCGVLFLIVAANVANLQLARATARQKELSVRLALGAGSVRIVRQLITESLILAVAGAALGIAMALWLAQSLTWLLPATELPIALDFSLNADILAFAILLCVILAITTGLAPALHSLRSDLNDTLKEGGRSGTSSSGLLRARGLLVVSEVALAMIALVGTGLFTRSFLNARAMNPGFQTSNLLFVQYHVDTFCSTAEQRTQFCRRLRERLVSQPGIAAVGYTNMIPLDFAPVASGEIAVEGYAPRPNENMRVGGTPISPGFLDAMSIPLLEGRDFTEQDAPHSTPVAIVNQAFARRFFNGSNPIGHRLGSPGHWATIVGLARDAKYGRVTESPLPFVYTPYQQMHGGEFWTAFFIRTVGPPQDQIAVIRREAALVEPATSAFPVMPFEEQVNASLLAQRVAAALLTVLGVVALLLAALGLYGVLAFAVGQREHEFGIRIALGAQTRDVLGLVVRQGMLLTLTGLAAGAILAIMAARLIQGMLVNLSPSDPVILTGAGMFLALVALLATYLPARTATKLDPASSLRQQ